MGRYGAILADEMGLGKTLQSVALSWTLLKQGPYGGKPVAERVLVVTPGSLVQNWGAEFNKWLGRERISVFTVDQVDGVLHAHSYLCRIDLPVFFIGLMKSVL